MNGAGRFAAGLALKGVLRRFTGRAEPAAVAARKRPKRQRGRRQKNTARPTSGPVAHQQPRRGAAFYVMMGSIALALPLMLLFETAITRIVGVVMLFTFILSGVFAIAQPSFLEADDGDRA
jgi:hypothetical protein